MTDKHSTDKLQGVPRTLLVPLVARAQETLREDAIIRDPKAVEMMARIDYDFTEMLDDVASILGIAVRTEIIDELVSTFIRNHPDATIVNLGSGLDARFYRMDNGRIRWIDLDLPESLAMRRLFFTESERHIFLEKSVLDFSWMDTIPSGDVFFIAEGLFMYFDEADVKQVLTTLAQRYPGGGMVLEVIGKSMAENTHQFISVASTKASFRWGIRHADTIDNWHENIHYVTDISVYDRHQARWLASPLEWRASLHTLRNTVPRIVHLQFD